MLALLITVSVVHAAPATPFRTGNPHLQLAWQQVKSLEEKSALKTLQQARRWPKNSPSDLAWVNLVSGLAHAGLAEESAAIEDFRTAHVLDPSIALPAEVSPRVRDWWARAVPEPKPAPTVGPENDAPKTTVLTPAHEEPPPRVVVTPMEREVERSHWARWTGVGLVAGAVVATSAAAVFATRMDSQAAFAQSASSAADAIRYRDSSRSSATMANASLVAAGALGASGVALITWDLISD